MEVAFRRTHRRGYAVDISRDGAEDLTMNPAPGYDDLLPHDLVHLLVELHWELRDGIFGQVAAGGNAGTFRLADARPVGETSRQRSRKARRASRQGAGVREMARSERLALLVHVRWNQRVHGTALPDWYDAALAASGATEDEVSTALAEAERLSSAWRRVLVGSQMVVEWPWPEQSGGRASRSA